MRHLNQCNQCQTRMLVYVTRRFSEHVVRYVRCPSCNETGKTVSMIPRESSTEGSTLNFDVLENDNVGQFEQNQRGKNG